MLFDQLWKQGVMPRPDCYAWLAKEMGIPERSCHFRNFKKKELRLAREKIDDELTRMTTTTLADEFPELREEET